MKRVEPDIYVAYFGSHQLKHVQATHDFAHKEKKYEPVKAHWDVIAVVEEFASQTIIRSLGLKFQEDDQSYYVEMLAKLVTELKNSLSAGANIRRPAEMFIERAHHMPQVLQALLDICVDTSQPSAVQLAAAI